MNPAQAYLQQASNRWTRAEMLLELYDRALASLERAQRAADEGDSLRADGELITAQRFITGIVSGLDQQGGPLVENLARLNLFVAERLGSREIPAALRVLRPLRDGFAGVRDDAIALERAGTIPEIRDASTLDLEA
jgi:flagellin-specific chaperone FliS